MPSSFTSNLRLTLPATGENNGTWGTLVNTGITSLVDSAIAGTASVSMSDADYTLTSNNGTTDEARCMFINLSGSLTTTRNVVCPSVSKLYFVYNGTSGGKAIVFKTLAGSGITVPNGKRASLYCDGTNVKYAFDQASLTPTVTISGDLDATGTDYAVNATNLNIKSTVNTSAVIFRSVPSTEAASFTLATLENFRASQGTFGAGSTVTTQVGFHANPSMVDARNNFGFYGAIPGQTASTISTVTGSGTTVTVNTTSSHGLTTNDTVFIANVPDATMTSGSYNGGPYVVTVTSSTAFTITSTATSSAPIAGGNVVRANRWNFYAAGTGQNYFGGSAYVDVNSVLPALRVKQAGAGDALVIEDSSGTDTSPFVIDSTGRLINGFTSSLLSIGTFNGYYQQHGTTLNTTTLSLNNWSTTDSNQGHVQFTKSGSGTVGVHSVVANNESLGRISFGGSDGTNFIEAARISVTVGGTPGTNDMPGVITFSTTADGASSPTDRMFISASGAVTVNGDFSAANVTSNTWTPTVVDSTNVASSTAGVGQYMRVGNVVTFSGSITIQATATGNVYFDMNPPVGSNFSNIGDAGGSIGNTSTGAPTGVVFAVTGLNFRLGFRYVATATSAQTFTFSGTYRII